MWIGEEKLRRPKRSVRTLSVLVIVTVLALVALVIPFVVSEDDGFDSAADCTAYGIPAGDPLATADPVMHSTSSGLFSIFSKDEEETSWYTNPWDTEDYVEAEGVALGRSFGERHDRSNYHLFTRGVDFTEPVGLLVRLHGDGAEEYLSPEGLSACLALVAETYNMITLVPRTPDERSMTWWRNLEENVDWLNSLVAQISAEYGLDAESVWWMGYSGGAELISYGLIPYSAESVTGGAILLGGGGAPERNRLDVAASLRERMPLYWVTGQRDDGTDPAEPFNAIEAATEGAQWYRNHGFARVHTDFPAEYDHFTLPHAAILQEVLLTEIK
ncbi:hypothetical protein J433_06415 [Corynebacterium glutamicum MT]|uniref:Alpha/beta hydrolase n=1 Tax=Corynebacterium glutamicum TaxID=1718 RepID=A0AB36IGJ4_CORGT|nr:hypothetical protein C624_01545 [Corynebacterium glutamicum SCgG1]AGN20921.1 hypothetical protein C629_01545 [Corynebacterium glutamicum SCgG2]EGV40827.1 hypothetical protein CgS9114_05692 [Corynebacterium glutamicum S9114]EOA65005.1 hypothetical protein J433_06415 [Corynebacterium glutamicum MT]EPP42032.1 hypothetical protein A583_01070 [Corynebacterium glutamicum Z188]OKX78030.1 hypothetical protein AUP70_08890 [Corynebacterium glutamicum]